MSRKCACFGINNCHVCDPVPPRTRDTIVQCSGCGINWQINEIAYSYIGTIHGCGGQLNEILFEDRYPAIHFTTKKCIKCQTIQDMIDYLQMQKENCNHI